MDVDVNVFFIFIGSHQKMDVYYSCVIYQVNSAIVHVYSLLTANQNKEYINVYIHIILNVNMIDLLWLASQTWVLPWKSLSVKSMASFGIRMNNLE